MSQDPFKQFKNKKKNSVVKEKFRQEKKSARKEKNAYFDKVKEEKYQAMLAKRKARLNPAAPAVAAPQATVNDSSKISATTKKAAPAKQELNEIMPLNKYLAHCGIASRRDTVEIINKGLVTVNDLVVKEPGYKVQPKDEIFFNGTKCYVTKNLVYILLNKPKDFITTTDDPQARKTVMELIRHATTERVYPVGRLDRNTSGVLLLTNDGDLTQKLSHPSFEIKKIYEAKLDKNLTKAHFDAIVTGLILEDGQVFVDSLAYADSKDKSIIGIEIHSGRNRIVRRIFESLGYDVKALDRVMYAGLTKKNVERGKCRLLVDKEIRVLKYLNASKLKKKSENNTIDALEEKPKLKAAASKAVIPQKTGASKDKKEIFPEDKKAIKKVREKSESDKPAKPRKFKTHSEKKAFKQQNDSRK